MAKVELSLLSVTCDGKPRDPGLLNNIPIGCIGQFDAVALDKGGLEVEGEPEFDVILGLGLVVDDLGGGKLQGKAVGKFTIAATIHGVQGSMNGQVPGAP